MCFSANGGKTILNYAVKNVFPEVKGIEMSLQINNCLPEAGMEYDEIYKKIVHM